MNKQRLRKLLIGDLTWQRMLVSLVFIYTFFAVYVYFRADSMIFLPPKSSYQDTKEIIKLETKDNQLISAIYLQNTSAKYTIMYIHGNAEDLGRIRPTLVKLRGLGFNVFAYDYRGYGTSQGKPSETSAYEDVDTAYNYLTQNLNIKPEKIIVFGRSVGGGSAVDLAARKPVGGLVLESAFTSAFRVVVPIRILPFDKFNNLSKIAKVKCPVLVMHGKQDEIVPFKHGKELFAAVKSPKLSLWVDSAKHNDFDYVAGEKYGQTLQEFVNLVSQS
ncbi:MAG: alpha/beta hydrolase [Sphaerospermopsis sp. SIO1G2]|nr:alpha/beta hydrolase [Sphaerospermopsis sp. SIO1G1]NET72423.1 alpha/beta hydrolase [Sphaerospermopsis sp. SIO1G2]